MTNDHDYRMIPPVKGSRDWRYQYVPRDGTETKTYVSRNHTEESLHKVLLEMARRHRRQVWRHDARYRLIDHDDFRSEEG